MRKEEVVVMVETFKLCPYKILKEKPAHSEDCRGVNEKDISGGTPAASQRQRLASTLKGSMRD
jgi:hypothetical protein